MRHRPTTLGHHLKRSMLKGAFIFACAAAFTVPAELATGDDTPTKSTPLPTPSYADQLATSHGLECWKNEAPAGAVPTHAIVERDANDGPRVVPAEVGFGIWLDGKPGTLYGFCR